MAKASTASKLFSVATILIMAGCDGGQKTTSNTTTTGTAMRSQAAPPNINCGAVQPVWVNTRTHVYHMPGDRAYGRTRSGKYLCPSAARAEGDHPAGGGTMSTRHHKRSTRSY